MYAGPHGGATEGGLSSSALSTFLASPKGDTAVVVGGIHSISRVF